MAGQVTDKSKYVIAFALSLAAAGIWWLRGSDVGQPRADERSAQTTDQVSAAIGEGEEARPSDTADRPVAGKAGIETASQLTPNPQVSNPVQAIRVRIRIPRR